jgi:uncharacterized RDD family membrane protein YckC
MALVAVRAAHQIPSIIPADIAGTYRATPLRHGIAQRRSSLLTSSKPLMGYSVWWLGAADKPRARVLDELGLELGNETHDILDAPLVGVTLPTGWFVVMVNRYAPVWYDDEALAGLSVGARVVRCEAEDHAMYSTGAGFEDGRRVWSMVHDEGQALDHLETEGDLPPEFAAVHAELQRQHDAAVAEAAVRGESVDVDHMHDAPAELAEKITGFRHDFPLPPGTEVHVLNALVEGRFSTVPVPRQRPPGAEERSASDTSSGPSAEPRRSGRSRHAETEEDADVRRLLALVATAKAPPLLDRAAAFILDAFYAIGLTLVSGFVFVIVIIILPGEPVFLMAATPAVPAGYMLLRDAIGKGISPGKRDTRIRAMPPRPHVMLKPLQSIRRNLTLVGALVLAMLLAPVTGNLAWQLGLATQLALIALEACLVLAGRERLGDRLAGTRVIQFPTLDEIKGRPADPPPEPRRHGRDWDWAPRR